MRHIYSKLLLKNVIYYKNVNRSLCHLNKLIQTSSKINNTANKYVSLTTNFNNDQIINSVLRRKYCTPTGSYVDDITFERVCEETLESLCEYFEALVENATHLEETDVTYSAGVLTVSFGEPYGTYVINRQSPNRQIWLSSPTSGPKRYDFIPEGNYWVYKHDNVALHDLLQKEITEIIKKDVDFTKCAFGCKL